LDAPHILRRKIGRRSDRQQAGEHSSRNSCEIHIEFDTAEHDYVSIQSLKTRLSATLVAADFKVTHYLELATELDGSRP
jgi:hypothetical protein